jgi:hypothetical protein
MSGFNPDEYLSAAPATAGFNADEYLGATPEVSGAPAPGIIESTARGGTQGLTAGFADEASGLLGAVGEKAMHLFADGLGDKSFGDTYREYRDAYRSGDKAAEQANPNAFGGSQVAGTLAGSALVPGASAAKLGLAGAASGLGHSEADTALGMAKDTAMGGAIGYGGGKALNGLAGAAAKRFSPTALEEIATSPIPSNISGLAKNASRRASKIFDSVVPKPLQEAVGGVADIVSGSVGQYLPKATTIAKGADKIARGTQSALAWALDKHPEKLGKFAPRLQQAAQRGASALATTSFLLQQKDPEFQQMLKDANEE